MNKGLKIGLIIGGSLAVAGAGFFVGRKIIVKRREKREEEDRLAKQKQDLETLQANLTGTSTGIGVSPDCSKKDRWIPNRNRNGEVINPYSELKNVALKVARKSSNPEEGSQYGLGYANVRNTPAVNNKTGTFDISNKIFKATGYIGKVVSESYDNQSPSMRWFKVKFASAKEDCSGYTGGLFGCDKIWYGWVRADNVTFSGKDIGWSDKCQIVSHCKGDGSITEGDLKTVLDNEKSSNTRKYKQTCRAVGVDLKNSDIKNSFNGMKQVYNTSYQLGASVFPHSNWEEQYLGADGHKFECNNGLTDL
jgi:hypothetical protein